MNPSQPRRALVGDAIGFRKPERIPIWMFNRDPLDGDILAYDMTLAAGEVTEWGYAWKTLGDGTMGQPEGAVLPDWSDVARFRRPDAADPRRLGKLGAYRDRAGDRYRLASLGITGFNLYTFLRGFENALTDFLVEPDNAAALLDDIMAFETRLIEIAAREGFDGVVFGDDWGTQQGLMISPGLWRELFKPRYRRQFEAAHRLGLHVWFHSCGNIGEMIPDLHEIGLDVMNISQPNVVDIAAVGRQLAGRQCFLVPISYQTVSISGTPSEIGAEAERLHRHLASPDGGFIGYVEDYTCMGMSETNYRACIDAFRRLPGVEAEA